MMLKSSRRSVRERAIQLWQFLTTPHPSVQEPRERQRAQLLAILSLITSAAFVLALFGGLSSYGGFTALSGIALASYALSRTRYYRLGAYLLAYAFTAIGYIRIYQGSATIDRSITTTVYIALVISNVVLSQRGFLSLAALSTIAAFAAPYYSPLPVSANDNIYRTGGIVFVISALLYGINVFRANMEKQQISEFQNAHKELSDTKTNLENRVAERTSELEKANSQIANRAARLQAIAEISQNIATNANLNLQEMLSFVSKSISEKTGYYHVGIFLLDENREYAVLRSANSIGGRRMLERNHQLKVGGTGIVGYVSQGGRARIALDTGTDAVFFNNPDLPETRSEMALPLKIGTQVIGTLDIQSIESAAFNDEDVTALSTLANQIAILIQNSQLVSGSDTGAAGVQGSRRFQLMRNDQTASFTFLPDGTLLSVSEKAFPIIDQAVTSGETVLQDQASQAGTPSLAVPVKLQDQVIGIIHLEAADAKRRWTEDEIAMVQAVSERAALALENASLFEATERRAAQEQIVAEVTTRIGESNNMERILQTTIQELGRTLGAKRAFIQLGTTAIPERDAD